MIESIEMYAVTLAKITKNGVTVYGYLPSDVSPATPRDELFEIVKVHSISREALDALMAHKPVKPLVE